jgi:preprotein translocase subunit SecG
MKNINLIDNFYTFKRELFSFGFEQNLTKVTIYLYFLILIIIIYSGNKLS